MVNLRLGAVTHTLPADFAELQTEASTAGYRMLDTLAREWASGANRFDRPGELLLAAFEGNVLAGIGGLTQEPTIPGALRMRRFYVGAAHRRAGVGRALATGLLDRITAGTMVTANAAPGSEAFWEALGFASDHRDGHSHVLIVASASCAWASTSI